MVGIFASLKWRLVTSRLRATSGATRIWMIVGLVVVAPLYVLSLHRVGIRASRVTAAVLVPAAAALAIGVVCRALASSIDGAFLAAGSAGLLAMAAIAVLAFWQRHDLRLLRAAARGREAT